MAETGRFMAPGGQFMGETGRFAPCDPSMPRLPMLKPPVAPGLFMETLVAQGVT